MSAPYGIVVNPPPVPGIEPPKYVKINGVRKLNPEYDVWQKKNGGEGTSLLNPTTALPVVSSMRDMENLRRSIGIEEIGFSESTDAAIDIFQDRDVCTKVGMKESELFDAIGEIFAKYEIPIGLLNKLLELEDFDSLDFLVDDSPSMGSHIKNSKGVVVGTRWDEVHERMKGMIEVLAYIPFTRVRIHFLNRDTEIILQKNGMTPANFLVNAYEKIDSTFAKPPKSGNTPLRERMTETFALPGRIAKYIFCDGEPNGGKIDVQKICKMVRERRNPKDNPVTFISCSDDDDAVEWMKEVESIADYCAEVDDFVAEYEEIRKDQGDALPYTRGFHLISQLVAAMNPDDLDALDESKPLTNYGLGVILGVESSKDDYRYYFDRFIRAQRAHTSNSESDRLKRNFPWEDHFETFWRERSCNNIPAVKDFLARLSAIDS